VHDANHIDTIGQESLEDQVLANRKAADVWGDVWAGATHVWITGEQGTPAVQLL
jgi:hypothetical protein